MSERDATDLLGMPLGEVGDATGRTYCTIMAYRPGDRNAPPDVLAIVANLIWKQSTDLAGAADEIDAAAGKDD